MPTLPINTDPFGGVTVIADALPADSDAFARQLAESLDAWIDTGYKLAWLPLPITHAALVPRAVEAGFVFHHATTGLVMLTRQLKPGAFVPSDASHFIGAGAVVINERRELLVIVEKYHAKDRPNFYKMPGGLLDPGEHLAAGVIREVLEETGVHTRFESVVCFRHQHGYRFGKSDFYFVCRLSPLSETINADPDEIADARWMPVDEYLNGEHIHSFNKHIVRTAIEQRGAVSVTIDGYHADPAKMEIFTL
jgi:8-oxo-dGTP pyrophosphatase MutT (NUDIX family)